MSRIPFRIRTIMIAIAAVAVLLSLVRFISQRPVSLGISFGLLVLFGTSAWILVTAFVVDLLAGCEIKRRRDLYRRVKSRTRSPAWALVKYASAN